MKKITSQLQRIAERYKEYENNMELKEDLLSILQDLKETEDVKESKPYSIGEMAIERYKELMDSDLSEKQILKTGFEDYDSEFGGIIKGELTVVGGRPGMGKTAFFVNLCSNIAKEGKPVAYISMELSNFQLSNRFISHLSKVANPSITKGKLSEQEEFDIQRAVKKLTELPIFVYDQYNSSIFLILERCRQLANEFKTEIIFIDYLQLVTANSKRNNREHELAFITRELKKLAKELNVAIVVSSQLSRQVENRPGGSKRPMLCDLRESGAIEQDADKVMFLYRPEYYGLEVDENNEPTRYVMEVLMAKNKTGNLEMIKLMCEKYYTGFKKYVNPYGLNISDERLDDLN